MSDTESVATTVRPAEEDLAQELYSAIQEVRLQDALRVARAENQELRLGLGRLLAASGLREQLTRVVAAWRGWTAKCRDQWV